MVQRIELKASSHDRFTSRKCTILSTSTSDEAGPTAQFSGLRMGLVVDTSRAYRVLETHHASAYYLPPEDIRATLRSVAGQSMCE